MLLFQTMQQRIVEIGTYYLRVEKVKGNLDWNEGHRLGRCAKLHKIL